jgi:homoserine kinase
MQPSIRAIQPCNEVSVAAPGQVANIFGYFDCAGFLCTPPPRTEASRLGGVGDIITVQFASSQSRPIAVEYLVRTCDERGGWRDIEPFSKLAEDIRRNVDRDIIQHVTRKTIESIVDACPELSARAQHPIKVTVVKCLPAGKVGIGLGSSAASTAVVVALDRLFGEVLRTKEEQDRKEFGHDPYLRLKIMADGERLASGTAFLDNVAPLLRGGLVFISEHGTHVEIDSLTWPRDLHVVTVTPDLSLETRNMRAVMNGKSINIFDVSAEIRRRSESMLGILRNDAERIIRASTHSVIEDVRWPLIESSDLLKRHIEQRRSDGFNVSLGISGSGPTVYCLSDSRSVANQMGEELHDVWEAQGTGSWWFVQDFNANGIDVFHCR